MSLKCLKGVKVSYKGVIAKARVKILSVFTLKSHLRKRANMYLCHVRNIRVELPESSAVPMVYEFENVFPDDIPQLLVFGRWILVWI